uniref:Uncharacterized protein n=1 Tax=Eutreptiella gymnastica TaxID=73025 RepID=A0A7S4CDH7_9EUGL
MSTLALHVVALCACGCYVLSIAATYITAQALSLVKTRTPMLCNMSAPMPAYAVFCTGASVTGGLIVACAVLYHLMAQESYAILCLGIACGILLPLLGFIDIDRFPKAHGVVVAVLFAVAFPFMITITIKDMVHQRVPVWVTGLRWGIVGLMLLTSYASLGCSLLAKRAKSKIHDELYRSQTIRWHMRFAALAQYTVHLCVAAYLATVTAS